MAEPDLELIEAQKAGEDICGRTPLEKVRDALDGVFAVVRDMQDMTETNFDFYVDGFTLASTETVGEIRLTDYAGRTCIVKSRSLTDWIQRRLESNA